MVEQRVELVPLKAYGDHRGKLLPLEAMSESVPFEIKRVYYMYDVPDRESRGAHAHVDLKQILICVNGGCTVVCDFGDGRPNETYRLDNPERGLIIEGMVWREMLDWAPGTVLLVLADEHFSVAGPKEIRNHEDFVRRIKEAKCR